jgi:hypothetical protein
VLRVPLCDGWEGAQAARGRAGLRSSMSHGGRTGRLSALVWLHINEASRVIYSRQVSKRPHLGGWDFGHNQRDP